MRAAFQGIHGAYSDVACRKALGAGCRTVPMKSFEDVFAAVQRGRVDRGVIPIENSTTGSVHQNEDLLIAHRVHIVGEVYLRIEHALMCRPGGSLKHLREVRSHPQALEQCSRFFKRHRLILPAPFFDTAGAAQSILDEKSYGVGAIASPLAATLYGLRILRRHVEDSPRNHTRFLIVARKARRVPAGMRAKCSIAFRPITNQPGILHAILGTFALRGIDLLRIESRPDMRAPFQYLFSLDIAGHARDSKISNALLDLRRMTRRCRVLGVYPAGKGNFYGGA
jgi:prephenate dehydratase